MPREDWVRTRAFCWMVALLHFDKILQVPLVVLHEVAKAGYREMIETFMQGDLGDFPILSEIRAFFLQEARKIQNGGPEYCRSEEWLNIWWPADEYTFIKLSVEGRLPAFYREAEEALARLLDEQGADVPEGLLHEAVALSESLMKQPFHSADLDLELGYNVWEFYRSAVQGNSIPLEKTPCLYHIDRTSETWSSWDKWCKEVVWYGNKKGALHLRTPCSRPRTGGPLLKQ